MGCGSAKLGDVEEKVNLNVNLPKDTRVSVASLMDMRDDIFQLECDISYNIKNIIYEDNFINITGHSKEQLINKNLSNFISSADFSNLHGIHPGFDKKLTVFFKVQDETFKKFKVLIKMKDEHYYIYMAYIDDRQGDTVRMYKSIRIYISKLIHEIRNDFNIILGNLELHDDAHVDALLSNNDIQKCIGQKHHKILTDTHMQNDSLLELVRFSAILAENKLSCLLKVEKIHNLKFVSHVTAFNVFNMMKILCESMQGYAIHYGVEFKYECLADSNLIIECDKQLLIQIYQNLISNSIKNACSFSNVQIFINTNGEFSISVANDGHVITSKQIGHIFTPFETLNNEKTENIGLGLTIINELVQALDLKLNVTSDIKTTDFTISGFAIKYIPSPARVRVWGSNKTTDLIVKKRIAIVDDDRLCLNIMFMLLQKFSVQADMYKSGEAVIRAMVAGKKYDICFMDNKMQGLTGKETIQILKKKYPELIVIGATGSGMDIEVAGLLNSGMSGVIQKPISYEKIYGVFEDLALC
jgi:CheY-like chemotaxis protein